jgi:hypothetical protein
MTEVEEKLIKTASIFLSRQMESWWCPYPIFQSVCSEKRLVGHTQRIPNLCEQ